MSQNVIFSEKEHGLISFRPGIIDIMRPTGLSDKTVVRNSNLTSGVGDGTHLLRDERRSPQRAELQLKHAGQRPFDVQRAGHVAGLALELAHFTVRVRATKRQRDPREILLLLRGLELVDLADTSVKDWRGYYAGAPEFYARHLT